ncbi:MAG: hemerythrin domain-containing protein [Myxococcales bacterium]
MSDIDRKHVLLAQHQGVVALASMVRAAAGAVLCAEDPVPASHVDSLERSIEALAAQLEAHLDTEEGLLRPVLWGLGSWGRFRFDMLRAEHVQQRATLCALRSERSGIETYRRARKAAALAEEIVRDVAVEERDLFSAVFPDPENTGSTALSGETLAASDVASRR